MPLFPSPNRRPRPRRAALAVVAAVLALAVLAPLVPAGAQEDDPDPAPVEPAPPTTQPPSPTPPTDPVPPTEPVPPTGPLPPGDTGLPTEPLRGATPPGPPPPPMADPSPRIRVLLAELEVLDLEQAVAAEDLKVTAARAELAAREAELAVAEQQVGEAATGLERARSEMGDFAVELFMYAAGGAGPVTKDIGLYERRQGMQMAGSVREHQTDLLAGAEQRLQAAEAERDRRAQMVAEASAVVEERLADRDRMVRMLDAARDELRLATREDTSAAEPVMFERDAERWKLSILGTSAFTPEELAAWFTERGAQSRAKAPIEDLARFYVEEGDIEGVRGDVAFAQAILETGSFSNQDTIMFNNYAGMGHCDSCPTGFQFESPQMGVRAQLQHVKSYADADAPFARPFVDERLRGPAGCCPTWAELTGVYATDPNYGPKILWIYQQMLEWLLPRRQAALALG